MASSNPKIPYVRGGLLYRHDGALVCAVADSLAQQTGWYDWLEDPRHKSFAFTSNNGAHCTCVKEKRKGSGGRIHFYWFAYRSIAGIKRRVALGKSRGVDLAKLSQAATRLAQLELIPENEPGVTRRSRDASSAGASATPGTQASPKREAALFGTPL